MCLGSYLPLFIGDFLPENEDFIRLLNIMDYILAPICIEEIVAYLDHLIELFLLEFTCLYLDSTVTSEMHYCIHYPDLIPR